MRGFPFLSMWIVLVACKDPVVPYEPPPVDDDRDGVPYEQDCDDKDPEVYPGAPEWCDGKIQDCGGSEDGVVTFDPLDGPREDWSQTLLDAEGDVLRLERSGTLSICNASYALALVAAAPDVDVEGVGTVRLSQPEGTAAALVVEGSGSVSLRDVTLSSREWAVQARSGRVFLRRVVIEGGGVQLIAHEEQDFGRVALTDVVVLDAPVDPAVEIQGSPFAKLDVVVSGGVGDGLVVRDVDEIELGNVEVREVPGQPIWVQAGSLTDGGLLGRMQVDVNRIDGSSLGCVLEPLPCGRVQVQRATGLHVDLIEAGELVIEGSQSIGVGNFLVERSVGDGLTLRAPEVRVFRGTASGTGGTALRVLGDFGQIQRVNFADNARGLWVESTQPFTLSGGEFMRNGDMRQPGGGMWVRAPYLNVIGVGIEDNVGQKGGAIYMEGELDLERSDLFRNRGSQGGAVYVDGSARVEDSNLFENSAGEGGAIFVDGDLESFGTAWRRNYAEAGGAVNLSGFLTSRGSVWGEGGNDNWMYDVHTKDCAAYATDGVKIDIRCVPPPPKPGTP